MKNASFTHYSYANREQKLLELRARGGAKYYGLYWLLIERITEVGSNKINVCDLNTYAVLFNCPLDEFIDFFHALTMTQLAIIEEIDEFTNKAFSYAILDIGAGFKMGEP